jgi:hypothetical protein
VFFLDPHLFMNVGYSCAGNSLAQLFGLQAASAKAGFSSLQEALVVLSYNLSCRHFLEKKQKTLVSCRFVQPPKHGTPGMDSPECATSLAS